MAISKTTRRELVRIGFRKEKIHLVFPGIGSIKKTNGEKYKKPTILYLGRIKKYKRVNMLVNVFRKVHKINPKVRLIIAGWGSEAPFISDFVMKNKLRKSIDIIGPVSEHEKADLYAKSWIFVNPSLHEGWGISVIEANAYKTPSIGFKVPGLSDSIVDGKTGYLCKDEEDMVNKILYIIENNKVREELSKDAFLWSKKFDWNVSALKGQRLIEKIANNK
jgi:glycosyltransferase involved in cell wall biosynthesis